MEGATKAGKAEPTRIKNRRELSAHGERDLRRDALTILEAGIEGGDPGRETLRRVGLHGHTLSVNGERFDLREIEHLYLVGVGKGSFPIAAALEQILGDRLDAGLVVVKQGETRRLKSVEILESSHPIPDEVSVEAARKLLAIVDRAGEKDIVFAAVTGGSSALTTLPPPGITLAEIRTLNDLLLRSGAVIREINAVRKHLCEVKGGRFVARIQPALAITLTLDTAPEGMPWPDMCLPDPSTFEDAIGVLEHYGLWERVSSSIRSYLQEGTRRPELETVKTIEDMRTRLVWVGDVPKMCLAAARCARRLGYADILLSTAMEGESREVGVCLAGIAKEIIQYQRPYKPPCALISGGETTVTVRETGRGGPNQEFVLSFARTLGPRGRYVCAAVDSDGTDGPTDLAGGIVDNRSVQRARDMGHDPAEYLWRNRSSDILEMLDDAIVTGHTGTNLQNLRVILIG